MKKLLKLALCLVLAASAAGCGNNGGAGTPTPDTSAAALTPGTYTATVTGHNAPITIEVTVSDQAIESINVVESSETAGIGTNAMEQLTDEIIANQTVNLDTITGSTITSATFISAVKDALTQAGADLNTRFNTEVAAEALNDSYDCDVLVIGMGIAGTAAAKEAAEAGKKVIVLEKQPEDSYSVISMAGDFGVVGSQIQKDLGIEWAPKEDIFNEFVKETGGRCDTWMMNYWYDHSGEDFDWFIEGADYEVLESTAANRKTDKPNFIRPKCFPPLETYNYKEEVYPYFHGTITTNPNMQWACEAAFNAAVAGGAELIYNAEGEQLIVENDKVVGAYAKTPDGYLKVNAKAVVLCCGDYGANPEMRHYYAPWTEEFMGGVDDGRGQLMGIWAGGWMELGPHAPMTHHMGGSLGVDSFLQLNMEGKRFMNEDVPGQNIAAEHTRQPVAKDPELAKAGVKAWQIFDSKWPEQIIHMPDGHGYTTYFVPDDQAAEYETVLSGFGLGYTTQAMVDERTDVIANSLEELAEKTGLPLETMKAEIERYNELCHKGIDEDFGKMSKRMFPVENPPYYACKFGNAGMLVMFGGLECDHELRVTKDGTNDPIPGLYVAGNTMGRRLLVDYPVVVAGISLGSALTFGRLAGKNAAAAV